MANQDVEFSFFQRYHVRVDIRVDNSNNHQI